MTMATASFKILSPKVKEFNTGWTLSFAKTDRVATGSVAAIKAESTIIVQYYENKNYF
jgi:hypothetical protein